MFNKLKSEGLEEAQNRLGGFDPIPTNIYNGVIKAIYGGKADSGALNVTVIAQLEDGSEYRETIYVSNRAGENFFFDKQDKEKKKKMPLPGFTLINDIMLITTGKELFEQEWEEKQFKVYDKEAKAAIPKGVEMAVDTLGKPVSFAIERVLENKNKQDSAGVWQPTAEQRTSNSIHTAFDTASKKTVLEAKKGSEAAFWDAWLDKNKGKDKDDRKIKGDAAGTDGAPPVSGGQTQANAAAAGKSLFGG